MEKSVSLRKTDGIAHVTLNRPEAYNSFDLDMVRLVADTLIELALDQDVTGVVISGEGKAFCAGGDLRWITGCGDNWYRSKVFA